MLGIRALAVITPYPEMGFDVDKVGHVPVAERILKIGEVKLDNNNPVEELVEEKR